MKQERIDALFAAYDKPETPGCALGVIQDGELVYSKGYGCANLEYAIPITPQAVFHIASISKQFTAMCIALLEEAGKIRLEEDIQSYFPQLPQYASPLTVGDLVYMTNGLPDLYFVAAYIMGIREDDYFTREEAWQIVRACDWLMFEPGTKWAYGNTGYFLLAELVEKVSGQTISEFAHHNIFGPLGMESTFFRDDRAKIIRNRAEGYANYANIHYNTANKPWSTRGDQLVLSADLMHLPGAGQVWSTVEDLARWDANFYANKLGAGSQELIKKVTTSGKLRDGSPANYAYGLFTGTKDGLDYVSHGGWSHGYSCYMHRIPAHRTTIVILANHTATFEDLEVYPGSCSLIEKVLEQVLEDFKLPQPKEKAKPETKKKTLDPACAHILGNYQDPEDSRLMKIESRHGRCVADLDYGRVLELVPVGKGTFVARDKGETFTCFEDRIEMQDGDRKRVFHRFLPGLSEAQLGEYTGRYRCSALDTTFSIGIEDGKLVSKNMNRRQTAVDFMWQPTIKDTFMANYPPFCPVYCITFIRNERGEIVSMVFRDDEGSGRENLVFEKLT